jgi:hypothetical protein
MRHALKVCGEIEWRLFDSVSERRAIYGNAQFLLVIPAKAGIQ